MQAATSATSAKSLLAQMERLNLSASSRTSLSGAVNQSLEEGSSFMALKEVMQTARELPADPSSLRSRSMILLLVADAVELASAC